MEMGIGDGRLQDARISASSVLNGDIDNHGSHLARLGGLAAWRPNHNTHSEWIMVRAKINYSLLKNKHWPQLVGFDW